MILKGNWWWHHDYLMVLWYLEANKCHITILITIFHQFGLLLNTKLALLGAKYIVGILCVILFEQRTK
jgi:hypothetical protein